jgi:hypothetical protein
MARLDMYIRKLIQLSNRMMNNISH